MPDVISNQVLRAAERSGDTQQFRSPAAQPPSDAEIRRRVIDRVIDLGGEAYAVTVEHGVVRLRGRMGVRTAVGLAERAVRALDGVTRLDARLSYAVNDCRGTTRA